MMRCSLSVVSREGGLASFEATRLATGYHNANRIEIHGERGAIRFDFERMNELGFYDASGDGATQGWTTIDVTRGGDGHPYAGAWWPDSHGLGYENTFVNQAADMLEVIGGASRLFPCPTLPTPSKLRRCSARPLSLRASTPRSTSLNSEMRGTP
jgi:predicted dehydrogenase